MCNAIVMRYPQTTLELITTIPRAWAPTER